MRARRWGTAVAVIASLSLGLSACSGPANEDTTGDAAAKKTSLNVGWNQPFYSYNTATSAGNNSTNANSIYLMQSNFWYYDSASVLQKNTSFGTYEKTSDDPLTVKYTVGEDTSWSDGTPVSAADLLLNWATLSGNFKTVKDDDIKTDEETGASSAPEGEVYFDTGVSAGLALVTQTPEISDDGKSLTLVYDDPFADWEIDMAVPIPAHVAAMKGLGLDDAQAATDAFVKGIQDNDKAVLAPISAFWNTGFDYTSFPDDELLRLSNFSYVMTDLKENEYMTLEKNPDYKGDFPGKIDTITIRYTEDPMAQVQALANGELDAFQPQVTTDVVEAAQKIENAELIQKVEGAYEHMDLTFNNKGPFDPATYGGDAEKAKLVRQAFLHALPRQEVVDKLIKPIIPDAEPRNSFLRVPGAPGYDEIVAVNGSADYAAPDPELSKKLLAQAGVKTPVSVRLMFAKDNIRRESEFAIYQPALEAAGFKAIDKRNVNWSAKLTDKSYDAVYFAWISTSTGVSADCEIFRTGGANNFNGYSSKQVDELCAEIAITTDPARQDELQVEVDTLLWEDAVGTTIFQFPSVTVFDKTRVSGIDTSTLSPTMFYGFWNWEALAE